MQQAVPSVWMITDRATGDASYVRLESKTGQWVIGPFTYTKEVDARKAAEDRTFLPVPTKVEDLDVVEVPGIGLVRGILNRFDPSETDVFTIDDGLLPLTEYGAAWVDSTTGEKHWRSIFDDEDWMQQVFTSVSDLLGVETIQVSAKEDSLHEAARIARHKIDQQVEIGMEPETPTLYGSLPTTSTFRVFTKGMDKLDRPDLEMVGIQALFVGEAESLVAGWAAYSLDFTVEPGNALMGSVEPLTIILRVVPGTGANLRLAVESVVYTDPNASKTLH
jgi:hypothetical protein